MNQHADRLIPPGDHVSGDFAPELLPEPSVAAVSVGVFIHRQPEGIDRFDCRCGVGVNVAGDGPTLTTTATDGLQQHPMGVVSCGDQRSVDVGTDPAALPTVSACTAHAEAGRQVAAGVASVDGSSRPAAATHGLQEQGMGVITGGDQVEACRLRGRADRDITTVATVPAIGGDRC